LLNCSVFQCGLFHLTEETVVFTKMTSNGLVLNLSNLSLKRNIILNVMGP